MVFNIFIIGCGSIGAIKEDKYDSPDSSYPLTWANAFYKHKNKYDIQLYFIDLDNNKSKMAAIKWGGIYVPYSDLNYWGNSSSIIKLAQNENKIPSIFIISSPTETHKEMLEKIIQWKPSFVIAEKPFTDNFDSAVYIHNLYESNKIPIIINYLRRYLPITTITKNNIEKNILGKIQQCRVIYTRGFKRDASHALDLCLYFFRQCKQALLLDKCNPLYDHSINDPSFNAYLSFELCKNVFITAVDGRNFDIFEIDIMGSSLRNTFINHGNLLHSYRVIPEPIYGDYNTMGTSCSVYTTELKNALLYGANGILDYLQEKTKFKQEWCTSKDAVKVHKIFGDLNIQ